MKKFVKGIVAAASLAAAAMGAQASVIMTIDDLSTVGVVDWTSGVLPSGSVAFHGGTVGNWTLSNSTGLGNGWSDVFGIDLNSVSASSKAGGTLRITFTETDLAFGAPSGALTVTSAIGGTTQGSVTFTSWIDDSNAAFGHGQQLFSGTADSSISGFAFSGSGAVQSAVTDPFSLTLQVDITHTGAKYTSFDFGATVPEPSSVALLGIAVLGAGVASRRRQKA